MFKIVAVKNHFSFTPYSEKRICEIILTKMSNGKPRVVKDYEKLSEDIQQQIKLTYPEGFSHHLISFTNKEGAKVSALPFETDETYYLVRMTKQEATALIEDDDDYDDDGYLREEIKLDYEEKHLDIDDLEEEEEPEEDSKDS